MCGIAGIVSLDGSRDLEPNVRRMTDVLVHRGPDDSGTYVDGPVALGFRRLSILDLEASGHQPMTSPDGTCTIVFNGEIYNYVELRERLEGLGYRFRSTGDTEVLLNAYCEWGEECLALLNGMWAFLIHDRRRNLVFGSRDRFGIKPLFVHRGPRAVQFASEIKAIRASGLYDTALNWAVVADFLVRQKLDETTETFYAGIEQIPPASGFTVDPAGNFRSWSFWSLPGPRLSYVENDRDEAIASYAELFEDSVRLHRRSDVPLAVFLSGGVDSTSIICSLARGLDGTSSERLKALAFMDPRFDESRFIDDTIRQTSADLERVEYGSQQIWDDLPNVLWYHDEPVHSTTALIGYSLSRAAAANGIKVILNGQGADETAAGYRRYFHHYWHSLLANRGPRRLWQEISAYTDYWGGSAARRFTHVLKRALTARPYRFDGYRDLRSRLSLGMDRRHPWFTRDLLEQLPRPNPNGLEHPGLDSQLRYSVLRTPLPLYLRIEDRNAMAHSVEIRVPFLDYRLVELLFSTPAEHKMRGPLNKYVIREAMHGRIPESVRLRHEKMGFPSPSGVWLAELKDSVHDALNDRAAAETGILDIARIRADFERHCRGEVELGHRTFDVLQFIIWHRKLIRSAT